jgi:hypothetical protein
MLKSQLARALQLPLDTRAEQGLDLLLELHGSSEPASARSEERCCDRMVALLRARLSAR